MPRTPCGGACLAIGRSILSRFATMYEHDQRAQAAAAILSIGSYRYEVFHEYWTIDDYAFLHFQVCGIDDPLHVTLVRRPGSSTSDENHSE